MKPSIIKNKIFRRTVAAIIWIGVWQIIYIAVGEDLLVSSPLNVARRLIVLSTDPAYWQSVAATLERIMLGFILSVIAGVLLAVFACKFDFAYDLITPPMNIIKATPVASFVILAIIWMNSTDVPVFISFLMVLPLIYSNVSQGIKNVDQKLLEMAKVFSFTSMKKVRMIIIPSVMPYFIAACSSGLGFAWKSGIAAEVIGIPKNAVGSQLYFSKVYLETADLFAWTVTVIVVSVIIEFVFLKLINKAAVSLKSARTKE